MQLTKISGICGILLTLVSITGVIVASVVFQLDWYNDTLSDMGSDFALHSKNIFNLSVIFAGIFSIVFSVGGLTQNQHIITKIGFIVLVITSFVLIGVGIFNLPHPFHIPFASAFFLCSPLAVFVIGIGMLQENKLRTAVFAFVVSIVELIFTGIMALVFFNVSFGVLNAITEFVVVILIASWIFFYSLNLLYTN